MNFTLCAATSKFYLADIFYESIGSLYYILAEFYLFLTCVLFIYIFYSLAFCLKSVSAKLKTA